MSKFQFFGPSRPPPLNKKFINLTDKPAFPYLYRLRGMRRVILDLDPQPRFTLADELAQPVSQLVRAVQPPGLWIERALEFCYRFDMIALTIDDRTSVAPVGAFASTPAQKACRVALLAHKHPRRVLRDVDPAKDFTRLTLKESADHLLAAIPRLLSPRGEFVLRVPFDVFTTNDFRDSVQLVELRIHTVEADAKQQHLTCVGHEDHRAVGTTGTLWAKLVALIAKTRSSPMPPVREAYFPGIIPVEGLAVATASHYMQDQIEHLRKCCLGLPRATKGSTLVRESA